MGPLELISEKLKKYPDLKFRKGENTITVFPLDENGFEVSFEGVEAPYVVSFDGWHENFEKSKADDALNCFVFGLSGECRLKVVPRGGQRYRWIMEYLEDGNWLVDSEVGAIPFLFWKKKETRYLQNKIIKSL